MSRDVADLWKGQCIVGTYLKEKMKRNIYFSTFSLQIFKFKHSNTPTDTCNDGSTSLDFYEKLSAAVMRRTRDTSTRIVDQATINYVATGEAKLTTASAHSVGKKKIDAEIQINVAATYTKMHGIYLSAHFRQQVTVKLQKKNKHITKKKQAVEEVNMICRHICMLSM